MNRPLLSAPEFAAKLHQLADQLHDLAPAEVVGALEALRVEALCQAMLPAASPPPPSSAITVKAVAQRMGMSTDYVYREARAGRLPFARRHGSRVVFDGAGLERWLAKRAAPAPGRLPGTPV